MVAPWRQLLLLAVWAWCACARVERPRCPSDASERCTAGGSGHDEYKYTVDGLDLLIEYTDGGYFVLHCTKNLTLDNPALPRFESQLRVNKARLMHCPPPRVSYVAALDALNVTVLGKLTLVGEGLLRRQHLAGLRLPALELDELRLAPDALAALPALRQLLLDGVAPPGELPRGLRVLQLVRTGAAPRAAQLARLPQLDTLVVREAERVAVRLAGALRVLSVEAPAASVPSALLPSLQRLTVCGWEERRPAPWTACDALDTLDLPDAAAARLPAGWVRACGRLRVLRLQDAARLRSLDAGALRGAHALQELHLTKCALAELPVGLLDDAEKLTVLDLSGNRLLELPSGLFARSKSLQSLNLSNNLLSTPVFNSLTAVTSLKTLELSNNVGLKDSCNGTVESIRGTSPLQYLQLLTKLSLRNTSATMICRDWRQNMARLTNLDLSYNGITSITYSDLQFYNTEPVVMNLKGNNLSSLHYTWKNYNEVMSGNGASHSSVTVQLDAELSCDCNAYWAARALRVRPQHVRLETARCRAAGPLVAGPLAAGPLAAGPLASAPLDALECAERGLCAGAPPACACAWREDDAPPGRRLRLHCERANLTRPPDLRALTNVAPADYSWDLLLANNRIDELRVDDLPKYLSVLDLRNNTLSAIEADVAQALVADERRRVWLAGNPLECGCGAAAALGVLRARPAPLADYGAATCRGGAPLRRAAPAACAAPGPRAPWAALAAGALLLGGALGGLLALPGARLRLKLALHSLGWLAARDAPDDGRRFDAFVSFSHGDERFVRSELVARLESGPAPYRLCVHYRDWAPGGWIPAQIAASVRASRRTVAVLSEHFLRSAWARAEFREAYALALREHEPRLVVVLLDDPAALPLDDKLRRYLASNTYLRWGDPWFWQKLRLALPRSRGREAPAPAPAAPLPAGAAPLPAEPAPAEPSSKVPSETTTWSGETLELDLLMKPSGGATSASLPAKAPNDATKPDVLAAPPGGSLELDLLMGASGVTGPNLPSKPSCGSKVAQS